MVEEVGLDLHRERDSGELNLALRILISFILVWFLNHLTWVERIDVHQGKICLLRKGMAAK